MRSADPIGQLLADQRCIVLDGGLATELERRGADLPDALWSARILLDDPDLIRQVHEDYFAAGADVAVSASYQASVAGFALRGIGRVDALRLMTLSVELAQEARECFWSSPGRPGGRARPLVAASIGPYGASLADGSEYRGHYRVSSQQLVDFHDPRLEAVLAAGPDLLAIETIPSIGEATSILERLSASPAVQAWVSFTCRDSAHISEGAPVTEAIAAVADHPQVAAVGFNCVPPSLAEHLLAAAAGVTKKPLVIYPNSGERWDAVERHWMPGDGLFDFGAGARLWFDLGARLIGGCCRTTPETIRRIRSALDALRAVP